MCAVYGLMLFNLARNTSESGHRILLQINLTATIVNVSVLTRVIIDDYPLLISVSLRMRILYPY